MFKIYCSKCGEKLSDESKFCTKCGAAVTPEAASETFVQRLQNDSQLQEHWIRRAIAYAIDYLIVAVAASFLSFIFLFPLFTVNLNVLFNPFSFPIAIGLLSVPYFTFAETIYGASLGKRLLALTVETKTGEKPSLENSFIRNISKIHWVLLFLDLVGGFITSTDLHQKYLDRIANTTVA